MKKNLLAILAAAAAFAACSKEIQLTVSAPASEEAAGQVVYTLSATAPQTKATLDETSGAFAWESGDQIAVYDNAQNKYQIFSTTGSGTSAEFSFIPTDNLTHDFVNSAAYYPVSRLNAAQTDVAGPSDIPAIASASDVPMTATNANGSLSFSYQAAVVKLTVENVPSFTESVEFINNNQSYAAVVSHSSNENMTFYFAVNESNSAASSIILYDTDGNEIIHKDFNLSNSTVSLGDLIPLKTKVGPVILIKNNVMTEKGANSWNEIDAASGRINLHTYISGEKDFTSYDNNNCQFSEITIGSDSYVYYVYPANYSGRTVHANIRCLGYDYPKLETDITIAGETVYTFGFAQGLKKANDKFMYAIFEGSDTADCKIYVEDGGSAVFGSWWNTNPTQRVVMYNDGSEKRFLNIYDITNCSASATFEPLEAGNKYYMYDWSWKEKVAFSDANGITDYYLVYKWEDPDHHVYNKDFAYLANVVY